MSLKYSSFANYEAFAAFMKQLTNNSISDSLIRLSYLTLLRNEATNLSKFYEGIIKASGYPLGLLLQILTVIFLVRGNSGYSPSAQKWFLIVVSADIAGTLHRTYELLTENFYQGNPDSTTGPGQDLMFLIWGLRSIEHIFVQRVMCKVFFIILYFPLYLSPIALTISSLIRCYCVKYPLVSKVNLTRRLDMGLILLASFLALAISVVLGGLVIESWAFYFPTSIYGIQVFPGRCDVPTYQLFSTNKSLQFIGFIFMLFVTFAICFLNMLSATIIIIVLFQSKKDRVLMSSSAADETAEVRATARLLGMNVTLLICFFFSRLLLVISTKIDNIADPVLYAVSDRVAAFLVHIPYFTNSLFIAGLSGSFYQFLLPCVVKDAKPRLSSGDQTF